MNKTKLTYDNLYSLIRRRANIKLSIDVLGDVNMYGWENEYIDNAKRELALSFNKLQKQIDTEKAQNYGIYHAAFFNYLAASYQDKIFQSEFHKQKMQQIPF